MDAQINKEYFDKNQEKALKKYSEDFSGEEKEGYRFEVPDDPEYTEAEFTDEGLQVTLSNNLGWFTATIPIDEVKMLEFVVKKINKMRTVLEGLK